MVEITAPVTVHERGEQARQVLARLDRPDVQHEALRQAVAPPDGLERRISCQRDELGRRGQMDDVHARGVRTVQAHDVALCARRVGDDRARPRRRTVHQRPVQDHPAHRVIAGVQRQAHVVDRHDRGHAARQWNHAVREMGDVGVHRPKDPRREELHPRQRDRRQAIAVHRHVRRHRRAHVDPTIGEDNELVAGARRRQVSQQALGVAAHARARRPKGGAVERDPHDQIPGIESEWHRSIPASTDRGILTSGGPGSRVRPTERHAPVPHAAGAIDRPMVSAINR